MRQPVLGSIVMGVINLGGTLLAASLMDRAGRRLLMLPQPHRHGLLPARHCCRLIRPW